MGEEPEGGDGVEVLEDALLGVVEPPGGPKLDFVRGGCFTEGANDVCEEVILARIEGVENGCLLYTSDAADE